MTASEHDIFKVGDLVALPRQKRHTVSGKEWMPVRMAVVISAPKSTIYADGELGARRSFYQRKCSSWTVNVSIVGKNRIEEVQCRHLKKQNNQ